MATHVGQVREHFLTSIRIVGRVHAGREQFVGWRIDPNVGVDESNVRPDNRETYQEKELERIANTFGISFD